MCVVLRQTQYASKQVNTRMMRFSVSVEGRGHLFVGKLFRTADFNLVCVQAVKMWTMLCYICITDGF